MVDLCETEMQLRKLHLLCESEGGYSHVCVCLLLQYLIQSCSRVSTERRGMAVDMH